MRTNDNKAVGMMVEVLEELRGTHRVTPLHAVSLIEAAAEIDATPQCGDVARADMRDVALEVFRAMAEGQP